MKAQARAAQWGKEQTVKQDDCVQSVENRHQKGRQLSVPPPQLQTLAGEDGNVAVGGAARQRQRLVLVRGPGDRVD